MPARQDCRHHRHQGLKRLERPRDVLDTVVSAETPEGILLELRPAGLSARFYAFALDWVIRLAIMYAAAIALAFIGGLGVAFWLILFFALEWFYPVAFELTASGATPGKRVFGLRVVMDNGLPVTPAASLTRNLLRAADFLPFGYGFAIVSMLLRRDCKRLGDIAAGDARGARAARRRRGSRSTTSRRSCRRAPLRAARIRRRSSRSRRARRG